MTSGRASKKESPTESFAELCQPEADPPLAEKIDNKIAGRS